MELDNVKKLWEEVNLLKEKQQFNDDKIKEMLKNKGNSVLAKLIWLEKIQLIIAIPLCVLFYFWFRYAFCCNNDYLIWLFVYFLFMVVGIFLAFYKYKMLKSIDVFNTVVSEVFERILKYQRIIQKEKKLGLALVILFLSTFFYFDYRQIHGSEIVWPIIIAGSTIIFISVVLTLFLYNKFYNKRINQIKESLKELEEFEEN